MMNRISQFFRKLARSCYDVEWYRQVRTLTVGAALRYAALLHLVVAVGTAIVIAPALTIVRDDARTFLREQIPADAYLAVENGVLTTNLPQPFERKTDDFTVIVDPSYDDQAFPEAVTGDAPMVFLAKHAVFVQVDATDRRIVPLDAKAKRRVTVTDAIAEVDKFSTLVVWLLSTLLALLYGLVLFAANAGFAWLSAYLLRMIGDKWGAPLPYDRWLVVALHAITLPTLVDAAAVYFGLRTPFMFSGLFILIIAAVFTDEKNQPTVAPPATTPAEPTSDIHTESK